MSVRVRLTRVGSRKNPIWRVVVADQRSPRDGRFIELIGSYNPQTNPSTIAIDDERLRHWLARGAQPSATVKQLVKAQAKSGGPRATSEAPATGPDSHGGEPDQSADEAPADSVEEAPAGGAGEAEAGSAEGAPAESAEESPASTA